MATYDRNCFYCLYVNEKNDWFFQTNKIVIILLLSNIVVIGSNPFLTTGYPRQYNSSRFEKSNGICTAIFKVGAFQPYNFNFNYFYFLDNISPVTNVWPSSWASIQESRGHGFHSQWGGVCSRQKSMFLSSMVVSIPLPFSLSKNQ